MTEEQIRAEFEEWYSMQETPDSQYTANGLAKQRHGSEYGGHSYLNGSWQAYRAGRSSTEERVKKLREAVEGLLAERSGAAQLSNACLFARKALEESQ